MAWLAASRTSNGGGRANSEFPRRLIADTLARLENSRSSLPLPARIPLIQQTAHSRDSLVGALRNEDDAAFHRNSRRGFVRRRHRARYCRSSATGSARGTGRSVGASPLPRHPYSRWPATTRGLLPVDRVSTRSAGQSGGVARRRRHERICRRFCRDFSMATNCRCASSSPTPTLIRLYARRD